MANTIDRLLVVLGIKTEGFAAVRQQVKGFTEGTSRDLASLRGYVAGFFTATFAVEVAKATTAMAARFTDLKEQSGLAGAEVQKLDAIFKSVGSSGEEAISALDAILEKRKEALEKGGDASKLFQGFGISEDELRQTESAIDLFRRMSKSANNPENTTERELYLEAFGKKRGGKMLAAANAMEQGVGENIRIMTDEDRVTLDTASKAMERAMSDFKVSSAPLVAQLYRLGAKATAGSSLFNMFPGGSIMLKLLEKMNPKSAEKVLGSPAELAAGLAIPATPEESTPGAPKAPRRAVDYVMPGADRDKQNLAIRTALDNALFKVSNPEQQRSELRRQLASDQAEAARLEKEGQFSDAAKLRTGLVGKAQSLAELMATKPTEFRPDSNENIGAFIGGAAAGIDPVSRQLQDVVSILREIAGDVPAIRAAVDANRTRPIDQFP